MKKRNGKFEFYYITRIENLSSILDKGIYSHQKIEDEKLNPVSISDSEVMNLRKEKGLFKYTNLYINPRNAMMYRVVKDINNTGKIVVIGIDGSNLIGKKNIKISIGNASTKEAQIVPKEKIKNITKFIEDVRSITFWTSDIEKFNIADYIDSPAYFVSLKKFAQSEILVEDLIDVKFIKCIYVPDEKLKKEVSDLIKNKGLKLDVILNPDIFFQPIKRVHLIDNIHIVQGDMFTSDYETLTISVNVVGVMGKGLASRFKYMYPDVYVIYQELCKRKELKVGKPYIFPSDKFKRKFLLFPTKRHWRENSKIEYIDKGLDWFIENYKFYNIKSVAFPALGCGLGKLNWKDVGKLMVKKLRKIDIPVEIYLPEEKEVKKEYFSKEFYGV